MPDTLHDRLRKIDALAGDMLELADAGELVGGDVDCGILLGTLRDCGYKLRQLVRERLALFSAADRAPPVDADDESPPSDTTGKRVLIVDDDPDVVTYLRTWFDDRGFITTSAADGAEALRCAQAEAFDLITLDVTMPDESGAKVFRQLRADRELAGVPVIVITAMSSPTRASFRRPSPGSGPEGFIVKPIDLQVLARLVNRLLKPRPPNPLQHPPGGGSTDPAHPTQV